jgi:hypothetical protein
LAIREAVVAQSSPGAAQSDNFGMSTRIVFSDDAVVAARDYLPIANDDCTDRYFTYGFGKLRFAYGFAHEQFIGSSIRHEIECS